MRFTFVCLLALCLAGAHLVSSQEYYSNQFMEQQQQQYDDYDQQPEQQYDQQPAAPDYAFNQMSESEQYGNDMQDQANYEQSEPVYEQQQEEVAYEQQPQYEQPDPSYVEVQSQAQFQSEDEMYQTPAPQPQQQQQQQQSQVATSSVSSKQPDGRTLKTTETNIKNANGNVNIVKVSVTSDDPTENKLRKALVAIKEEIVSKANEVKSEKKWVDNVNEMVEMYNKKMWRVNSNIDKMKGHVKILLKKKKQIENAILQRQLESKLKDAQGDMGNLQAAIRHVSRKASDFDKARNELQSTINLIQQQMARLRGEEDKEKKLREDQQKILDERRNLVASLERAQANK